MLAGSGSLFSRTFELLVHLHYGQNCAEILIMASSESLVNFRPFYTLQPVLSTRQRQLAAWMEHIIDWSRASRVSAITVGECELFVNAEIDRRLDDKAARAVLDHLVASGASCA